MMMKRTLLALLTVIGLVLASCATPASESRSDPVVVVSEGPSPTVLEVSVSTTTPLDEDDDEEDEEPESATFEDFDRADFDRTSIDIDNEYLPLQPGTMVVYDGSVDEDGDRIPHQIISIVTDLVKVIDGVSTVVIWERDLTDDELVEAELAFFAQDKFGNVWRMGEYPEEYEDGELVEAPAWLSGVEDAVAGIAMPAVPLVGTPSYSQGWGPEVDFIDRGRVDDTGLADCVFTGCYVQVLRIEEFNVDEPGVAQLKYFAPALGNIRVDWKGVDESMEELELIEILELSEAEMTEVRAAAFELEARAYARSPLVYGTTLPSQRRETPEADT